jgi:hypothetical protein
VGQEPAVERDSATDAFLARPCAEFTDVNGDRQAICLPQLLTGSRKTMSGGMPEHLMLSMNGS